MKSFILSIFYVLALNVLSAKSSLILDHHYGSTNFPQKRKFYDSVLGASPQHCILRIYDYSYIDDEYEPYPSTVYSIHEYQDGNYYGVTTKVNLIKKGVKKEGEYLTDITYFKVDNKTIEKIHNQYLDIITKKKFTIEQSPGLTYEEGFSNRLDIRYKEKGDEMLRFIENIYLGKENENEFYHYILKASFDTFKTLEEVLPEKKKSK